MCNNNQTTPPIYDYNSDIGYHESYQCIHAASHFWKSGFLAAVGGTFLDGCCLACPLGRLELKLMIRKSPGPAFTIFITLIHNKLLMETFIPIHIQPQIPLMYYV